MSEVASSQLPEGWKVLTVKSLGKAITGNTPPTKDPANYGGDIPFIKPTELIDRPVFSGRETISEKGAGKARILPKGGVLVSCIGNLGKTAIAKRDVAFNQQINAVVFNEFVIPEYGFYYFQTAKFRKDLESLASATTISIVNKSKFESISVPLAPPEQQKRIVAKIEELFSHIDAGIEALKKAQKLLKQYRQSVLKAAVTGELTKKWREENKAELEPASQLLERILKERRQKWEEQQLKQFQAKGKMPKDDKWKGKYKEPKSYEGDLFPLPEEWCWAYIGQLGQVIGGLTKNRKREQFELQLPYLRVANVYANELRLDDVTKIGVQERELERLLLETGDLLVVEGNGSPDQIGRLAVWDGSIDPCVHQNHLIKIRLIEKESGEFLMHWLGSMGGRNAILDVASSTSGLYTLSISKVEGLPVPLAPLEEMIEIETIVGEKHLAIARLERELYKQLIQAEKNKQSILASAFLGKLKND